MQKKTVISVIVIAMILVIALYFITGTYARYIDTYTGTDTFAVAKWVVSLKQGETVESKDFTLTFTPVSNDNVATGKLAPGTEAVAEVEVDLTGTEVAVDIIATVDTKSLQTTLASYGTMATDITVTPQIYKGEESSPIQGSLIQLPNSNAFQGENGKYKIKITAKWTNNEKNNENDTKAGAEAESLATLSVPVKLEIKQHLASDS